MRLVVTSPTKSTVQAISHLRARHEVKVLYIGDADNESIRLPVDAPPAGVATATIQISSENFVGARLAPAWSRHVDQAAVGKIKNELADADWVWLEAWPLSWTPALRGSLHGHRPILSWSDDAASLLAFRGARTWVRRPSRAIARGVAGVTSAVAERRYLSQMDLVIARSSPDARWLQRTQRAPVHLLGVPVVVDDFASCHRHRATEAGPVVAFIGSTYEPNLHGIRDFVRRTWPHVIAAHPAARLLIAGRGLVPVADTLAGPGIEVLADFTSVPDLLKTVRVVVCPVHFGAGLPRKILDGGAAKRPTVITPYCAKALGGGEGFIVATDRDEWISQVVDLLESDDRCTRAGSAAYERVRRDFDAPVWLDRLSALEAFVESRR